MTKTPKSDARAESQLTGLLVAPDADLRAAAAIVLAVAPSEFGTLDQILIRANKALTPADRALLTAMVVETIRAAAAVCEGKPDLPPDGAAALADRVAEAQSFLTRREEETARRQYSRDLLLGACASLAALIVIALGAFLVLNLWLGRAIPAEQLDAVRDVLVAVGGGAAGACVSVLLRMHKVGVLTIEAVSGGAALYRIVLGWFFAAALVFLLKSGLLSQIVVIPDPNLDANARVTSWFFWGAVGFLAGFNERWATNLITREPGEPASSTDEGATVTPTAAMAASAPNRSPNGSVPRRSLAQRATRLNMTPAG